MAKFRAGAVVLFLVVVAAVFAARAAAGADLVDINHATVAELKTLPGIRDAWAAAIVRNRPYQNKAQLLSRKILPFSAYKAVRELIIAKQ